MSPKHTYDLDDADCVPCSLRLRGQREADERATLAAEDAERVAAPSWSGVLCVEDKMTGDGRLIEAGALRWENLPIPLRWASSDVGAHDGAEVVGRILTIERGTGGQLEATGDFDVDSEVGREAARHVAEHLTNGVSVDLDDVSFEVRVARELLGLGAEDDTGEIEVPDEDAEGRIKVVEMNSDDEVMVTTSARIRAATIVAIPAFSDARIDTDVDSLTASADPQGPPAAWFEDPQLGEPTPLVVEPDGRVYGHLATWGTCHIGYSGQCVQPPPSPSGYRFFHTGTVLTPDGPVGTGRITLDTSHADKHLSAQATIAHYENTGTAVADVRAGEDAHGIWLAGYVRVPGKAKVLRASPVSGDWREMEGHLELVGALSVNIGGFPVPRPAGLAASGRTVTLVASGMLAPKRVRPDDIAPADLRYLKRLASRARQEDKARVQRTANRVRADKLARRVKGV